MFNSAGLKCYYRKGATGTVTAITLATQTVGGAWSSGGFVETDATNMKGMYRFDIPDTVIASAGFAYLYFSGATNLAVVPVQIQISAPVNVVQWNGTNVATPATAGIPDVNIKNINNVAATSVTAVNANIGTTQPVNFTGTGASALAKSDMVDVAGAAVSTSTAQIGVNVVNWFGSAVASTNTAGVPVVDTRRLVRQNTAQATGNSTTAIKLDASASATTGYYKGMLIQVISGTGAPQAAVCTAYDGVTKIATVTPAWPTAPDNTSVFQIFPAMSDVESWVGVTPNALISSGRVDAAFNVRTGVARSGTAGTIQLDAGVPAGISGVYDNQVITIVAGTGAGRSRAIQNMGSSGIAFVFPNWDASGVPDTTSIFTLTPGALTFSGLVNPASGANAVVPPATLSGVIANSGLFVSVPVASISGVQLASGTFSGQPLTNILSGAVATILSGAILVNAGTTTTLGGGIGQMYVTDVAAVAALIADNAATQTSFNVTLSTASGFWDDALVVFTNGALVNQSRPIATYKSGVMTFDEAWTTAPASGDQFNIKVAHIHPVSQIANQVWDTLTSGHRTSGTAGWYLDNFGVSGIQLMSGWPLSGLVYVASGAFVNATATVNSGQVWLASGSVILPSGGAVALLSGQSVLVYSGQLSGQPVSVLSGQLSGQPVAILSGQLSGQGVTARTVSDKSGYVLGSDGLDVIWPESGNQAGNASGLNARQSLAITAASAAGRLSGAGTSTVRIDAAGVSGTLRINATVNQSGDRVSVILSPP